MTGAQLVREASTGLLVTVAAIPLAIGLAAVAGVPPATGLYTCIWPLVAFAILGSSRHLKLGMDASSAALIASTVPALALGDPDRYLAVAATLTFVSGAFVLTAGLLRLGVLADLLSLPVLAGYTAGIAASVVIGQLPTLLGFDVDVDGDLAELWAVITELGSTHLLTLATSALALLALLVLRRLRPTWPQAAIVLVLGIAISALVDLGGRGVAVVGSLPSGLPVPGLPDLAAGEVLDLIVPAAAVALVIAADTVITSRSFAVRLGYDVSANKDLVGLGAANLASSATGGVIASASYARTAISERNGSRSQLAGVVAAGAMILVLLLATDLIAQAPVALLAVIVVDAVVRLVDPRAFRQLARVRRVEASIAVVTFVAVLVVGLLPAIGVAVGASLLLAGRDLVEAWRAHVERPSRPRFGRFATKSPTGDATAEDVVRIAWSGPLIFVNAGRFRRDVISALAGRPGASTVELDARDITMVDATAADLLAGLDQELQARGGSLRTAGLTEPFGARLRGSAGNRS